MAKTPTRPPSARDMIGKPGGFSFATGGFIPERESEREPDMSKMPAMKPMASHTPGELVKLKTTNTVKPLLTKDAPIARKETRPTRRAPVQRSLSSGGR